MKRELENEISILNKMITSLAEILEEKGIMTNEEWEQRIREKIEESKDLTRFEDLGGSK